MTGGAGRAPGRVPAPRGGIEVTLATIATFGLLVLVRRLGERRGVPTTTARAHGRRAVAAERVPAGMAAASLARADVPADPLEARSSVATVAAPVESVPIARSAVPPSGTRAGRPWWVRAVSLAAVLVLVASVAYDSLSQFGLLAGSDPSDSVVTPGASDGPASAGGSPGAPGAAGPSSAPTPTASATPTATASSAPTPTAGATATPTPTATPVPTATPTAAPTATPTLAPPASRPASSYLLLSPAEIASRPMSGAAWTALKARADTATGTPHIADQDDGTDITVLAKALVWARTGTASYRTAVVAALRAAVGSEAGGRTLALGRNLPGYVIAADLVDLASADPAFDADVFRPWLRALLSEPLDGLTLVTTHERRPNNWGTHAGASRAAIARYLRDSAQLARTATVFRGYLGDRSAYAGFDYGDTSWQCDPAHPVGINPAGCTRDGHSLDGVLPDDQRRGGSYSWPPPDENYVWEALQGASLQAELLHQGGYDAWAWGDAALARADRWLYAVNDFPAEGDDEWVPWLIDARTGTASHGPAPARPGKNFGFTDWLYPS